MGEVVSGPAPYVAGMRQIKNTSKKRGSGRVWALPILPFAVFLALVLPVGAGAGVKLDASDPSVRVPASLFGALSARASRASDASWAEEVCGPGDGDENASWAGFSLARPRA